MIVGDPVTTASARLELVPAGSPPPTTFALPAFELQDHNGDAFGSKDLQEQLWVASFFFTSCPSICPQVIHSAKALRKALDERGWPVQLVTFTVDPQTDTPEVLREYAQRESIDLSNWHFVTGDRDQLEKTIVSGFKQVMGEATQRDDLGDAIDIAHGVRLVLVDKSLNVRGLYSLDEGERQKLLNDIEALMTSDSP